MRRGGGVGLRSCAHWLNWRLGTSLGAAREQVRVGRALEQLPCTRAAFSSGELSYSKVRAITRIADPTFEENLVDMARYTTASQLERIVREYRRADPEEQEKANRRHLNRYLRSYSEDDGMVMIKARLSPEDGAIVLAAIEAAAVSKLLFRADGSVEQIGSTRTIPRKMRRALSARDRHCRFPGCNASRFLHAHHVVYWSLGGPTSLSNLVLMCSAHHRLVHEGGWRLSLRPDGALRVFTPTGAELPAVPRRAAATGAGLAERHEAERLTIDDETLTYSGERFDMAFAIDCLLWSAGKAECFWKDFTNVDDGDGGNEGSAA